MIEETEIPPLGFVRLVDTMPAARAGLADTAIVQAARISTGSGTGDTKKDEALIRYLMRNKHTSPFEMVELKFHLKMPIFVARQWMRHRTASINEYSGRYSEIKDEVLTLKPFNIRLQSKLNKQSSYELGGAELLAGEDFISASKNLYTKAYAAYTEALEAGIAREQARTILPQSMYTEFYWKIDLHNFFHLVKLRSDKHAQQEIQEFSNACYAQVKKLAPISCRAFEDYNRDAVTFSAQELAAIKSALQECTPQKPLNVIGLGATELVEFKNKLMKIGIKVNFTGK